MAGSKACFEGVSVVNVQQVTTALLQLRQRNKYQDNAVPPWYRLNSQGNPDVAEPSEPWALDHANPALAELTVSARKQAGLMVSTAVKVRLTCPLTSELSMGVVALKYYLHKDHLT